MRHPPAGKPRRRPARRRLLLAHGATVTIALAALVLSAAAFAYWTTTGAGAASATGAGPLAVTLSVGVPSAELYPGGAADVAVHVSNPNVFAVRLVSVSLDSGHGTGGFDVDAGHPGCDPSVLSFTTQTDGWTVPPRVGAANGSLALDLPGALAMGASAADACQGASFVVHLNVGS
jgi:hypothetical protein